MTVHSSEKNSAVMAQDTNHIVSGRSSIDYLRTIAITFVLALLLKMFVLEAFRIPSGSMEDTLLVGDFLLVSKISYSLQTPRYLPFTKIALPHISIPMLKNVQRGDVIVFEFPMLDGRFEAFNGSHYIKRCVGLPGDTVTMVGGDVFVNGVRLSRPKWAKGFPTPAEAMPGSPLMSAAQGRTYGPLVVPKKGDTLDLTARWPMRWKSYIEQEGHSLTVERDGTVFIDGEVASTYVLEQDYYFVLGDNRENSLDSRYWGFVPRQNIIGEALIVYWSWNPDVAFSNITEKLGSVRWERIGLLIR
jgi:signal peptidase I